MSVKQRGRVWQVDVKLGSTRYRPSFETEQAAKEWEEDARHAFKMGRPVTEPSSAVTQGGGRVETVRQLLDMVKADWVGEGNKDVSKAYRNGEMFLEWFGENRHPNEIDDLVIDDYVIHLREGVGNAGGTLNRKLSVVRMILKKAIKRRMITHLPEIPLYDETKGSLNWLNFGEEDSVLGHLEHRSREDLYDLVVFLIDTGARINEALTLEYRTIRPKAVTFENRKNGNMSTLPLTPRAIKALQRRRQRGTNPDRPFGDIKYDQARSVLRTIYKTLGGQYANITQPFHVFRHSCASRLATQGVDANRIKRWMDHSSLSVTERYMKLAPDALEGLEAFLEPTGRQNHLKVVS